MGTRVNDAARKAAEEAAKKAAEEAKVNASNQDNANNDDANNDARIVDLSEYHGKDADDITRLLLDRPDFENHDSLIITNIIDNSSRYAGALTIVVNRNLPQFVKDAATGDYVESVTRNIFTTRIQLNAILKGQGEPMLANAVMTAPLPVLLVLFKKARISVLGHVLGAGEIFVNPYASKMAREERVNEHDRYEYFPYELSMRTLSLQDEVFISETIAKYQPNAEGAA
jgi:hypothetical protein